MNKKRVSAKTLRLCAKAYRLERVSHFSFYSPKGTYRCVDQDLLAWFLKNTWELIKMVESVPARNINLGQWGPGVFAERHTCGSVHCIGGWSSVWPYFAALGVTTRDHNSVPRLIDPRIPYAQDNEYAGMTLGKVLTGKESMFSGANRTLNSQKREAMGRLNDHWQSLVSYRDKHFPTLALPE